MYFYQGTDYAFVHCLHNLADGKIGAIKFLAQLSATFTLKPLRLHIPKIDEFLMTQKCSDRAGLEKTIEEMFPPWHINSCYVVSTTDICNRFVIDMLRFGMRQVLSVYLRVAGFVTQLLKQLAEQQPLPKWEMPAEWRSEDYFPDELEEYLRDKWKEDLASSVLQVPLKEVAWWNKKMPPQNMKHMPELFKRTMSCMQLLCWKPIPYRLPPIQEHFYVDAPLIEILLKRNKNNHPFKVPARDLAKIRFNCVQSAVPPILALKYHKRNIQGLHSMKIAAWFASWCTVVPIRNVMKTLLASTKDNEEEKKQLVVTAITLLNWTCDEDLLPEDQISFTINFLACKDVLGQFLTNYTIRQQWFVAALFSILKIERETIPLQVWPLPVKHIEAVIEVLTTVKMVKELTLLGLYCHQNDMYAEMREFTGKFQAIITTCLKVFSEKNFSGLCCLKTECFKEFSFKGKYVNPAYFELDESISCYYSGHPWNFEYYKRPSQKKDPSDQIHDPIGLAECSYDFWKDPPLLENCAHMPDFKGLLGMDAYALIRNNSWNQKGKFVKEVISAMACMGYIPADECSRVVNIELESGKFDTPLSAIQGGDYTQMDSIGRIGCHCLLLLNCTNTFKAPGQVLSKSAAMTLVGSLIHLSYETFEMNHLHRLAFLLGAVCGFKPVSPLKAEEGDFTHILEFIRDVKEAELSILIDQKSVEKYESLNKEVPTESECGVSVCGSWLREQLSLQLNSIWSNNHENAAAAQWAPLLHYLFPCYIHLYEEQNPIQQCSGVFFDLINQLMSSHQDIPLKDVNTGNVEIMELKIIMPSIQNKCLQVLNSILDQMNGNLCHKLTQIFLSTNWCFFDDAKKVRCKNLATEAANNYSNLWRLHYEKMTTVLLELTGINMVYDKDYIFHTKYPALSKPFKDLCMVHQVVDLMYYALKLENGTEEFKEAMLEVSSIEVKLHSFRSCLYYILSRFSHDEMQDKSFFYICCQIYRSYWLALCKARDQIPQEMSMAFLKLPNDEIGNCVASFYRGDLEQTNLLIEPIIPYALAAKDHLESGKTTTDAKRELLLVENNDQPVVNMGDSFCLTCGGSKGSDDGKQKLGNAKKSFKPPKELIEALQKAQKPPNKILQEEEKPEIEALQKAQNQPNKILQEEEKPEIEALQDAQKPPNKTLQEAEKPQNDIEEHTCNWCKISVNENFLTCEECLKTGFPNVHYYCSKACQAAEYDKIHQEEHIIFELEKYFTSMFGRQE
ncbi:Hypothetical predicted protein [Cloeon dipterum]|nr:Hypothetical predicted protein [Cloeon dipterum]